MNELVDSLLKDLRYGARMLASNPGFTLVAVLSLALGIGVNTTIFSIVNAVLLRPMPVAEPGQLVEVYTSDSEGYPYGGSSFLDYADLRDQSDVFSGLIAHFNTLASYNREAGSELVFGEIVSGNYFDVLGVQVGLGRAFLPEEDETPGTHPVVILGHGFWERQFAESEAIVGQAIKLNGSSFTVVGVAPESFTGTIPFFAPDFWVPRMMEPELTFLGTGMSMLEARRSRGVFIKGRLKTGVTLEEAEAQVKTIGARLAEEYPESNENRAMTVLPSSEVRIHPFIDSALTPVAGMLMVVVGMVLLIACANVANMLLARASVRRREIAVRLALGAIRVRLVRQLLTESILLALAGGALGLLITYWTTGLIYAIQPPVAVSIAIDFGVDARVLGFTLLASLLTGLVFGLAPALQSSRPDLIAALKDEAAQRVRGDRFFGLRNLLVVTQVAVSLVLLVAAGLFVRSLINAQSVELGFEEERVAIVSTQLDVVGYEPDAGRQYLLDVLERVQALPDADAVSLTERLPLGLLRMSQDFTIEGFEQPSGDEEVEVDYGGVGPRYFRALGIPLVVGREFTAADAEGAPLVAVVNETMARRYWPGETPIGKRISEEGAEGPWYEVVGVVKDHKVNTVGEDPTPFVYLSFLQRNPIFEFVVVRTAGDPAPMVDMIRREMLALDPEIVFFEAKTMRQNLATILFPVRMGAAMLAVFGFLALGLAAVGLYGVVAYAVSQRVHEIGIRMALGAERADVLRMVVRQGMAVVGVGVALGLAGALAVTWVASSLLYGVSTVDPLTFGFASLVLVAVALVANYIPARRGASVDPMVALRYG